MTKPMILLAGVGSLAIGAAQARAADTVFTIDSSQSQVTLSGKIAGESMAQQGPGSLTTSLGGTIQSSLTGSDIQFTGQSLIDALTNGVWQPAVGGGSGSAAADYGAQISVPFVGTAYAALRNIAMTMTSPALPLSGGNFDSSALVFAFASNANSSLDYNAGFLGSGSQSLNGYSTNNIVNGATLAAAGAGQKLTISVKTQFTFSLLSANDTTLNLTGQLVATNSGAAAGGPVFSAVTITNHALVLTAENTTGTAQLQSSTNLSVWTPATATIVTNGSTLIYTVPVGGGSGFYRIQQ